MKSTLIALLFLLFVIQVHSQITFKTIAGSKANYSISIPSNYTSKTAIGANVDLKYVNSEGVSIVTVVNVPLTKVVAEYLLSLAGIIYK